MKRVVIDWLAGRSNTSKHGAAGGTAEQSSLASVERFAHEGRKILATRAERTKREADERQRDEAWRLHSRETLRSEKPPTAEALLELLPALAARKPHFQPEQPLTPEQLASRRAEQLAALQVWMGANGGK